MNAIEAVLERIYADIDRLRQHAATRRDQYHQGGDDLMAMSFNMTLIGFEQSLMIVQAEIHRLNDTENCVHQ